MSEITKVLKQIHDGHLEQAERLLPLVYDELRRLAQAKLANEKPGQTLQSTALVHEAYVKLTAGEGKQQWNGKAHFFGAAAEAMRRILVDSARRKRRAKHGGELDRVELEWDAVAEPQLTEDVVAIDQALTRLGEESPRIAELVKLRYFAGMTANEAAEVLGISRATAARHWAFAKAFLYEEIKGFEGKG